VTDRASQTMLLVALMVLPVLSSQTVEARPSTWAQPVSAKHLKNFYKLDAKVYRSAQPDWNGFRELPGLGIRNVLSFRNYHSDAQAASGTDLKLYRIEMEAGEIRTDQVIEALKTIRLADGPILIHDWHGADRTGLISALYRIVFQGWSKESAIDELMNGGYGYHPMYRNLLDFIRAANITQLKQAVNRP
jgi:tyrosine-protein phosphatase SIW14